MRERIIPTTKNQQRMLSLSLSVGRLSLSLAIIYKTIISHQKTSKSWNRFSDPMWCTLHTAQWTKLRITSHLDEFDWITETWILWKKKWWWWKVPDNQQHLMVSLHRLETWILNYYIYFFVIWGPVCHRHSHRHRLSNDK